jgi:Protein of unknown function (DUF2959)
MLKQFPNHRNIKHLENGLHRHATHIFLKYTSTGGYAKNPQTVHQRIAAVENVAEALFKEWEVELAQYTNETLRRASARQLAQTRQRYTPLLRTMKRAEATMTPVLAAFRDQVLFLKHNLNARAIAAIRQEGVAVETEITGLIRAMESAIAEADAFIKTLDQGQES